MNQKLWHFNVYITEYIYKYDWYVRHNGIFCICLYENLQRKLTRECVRACLNVCLCASERVLFLGIAIKVKCHPLAQYVYLYAYDLLPIVCKLFT